MKLSLVVPCYNEQDNVQEFYHCTKACFKGHIDDYEIVFVNDGSADKTLEKLKTLVEYDEPNLQIISFSRNFGKESAIYAGLARSKGERVCIIDADLQQRPEVVLEMMKIMDSKPETDCVCAYQEKRKESGLMSFTKSMFYKIINKLSEVDFVNGASDFRLMNRTMVNTILSMTEYHRFSKGIFGWIGFKTHWLPYKNVERIAGETKWNFWGLFKYSLEGIINFSQAPLSIASLTGLFLTFVSFCAILFIVVRKLIFGDPVAGWASTACIILLMGGLQLLCMGIMGQYIAKTYLEVKKRPHFIIAETNDESAKLVQ